MAESVDAPDLKSVDQLIPCQFKSPLFALYKEKNMKLIERIEQLSKIGATENGICRLTDSIEDIRGKSLIMQWMLEDGLTVSKDIYGNIRGTLPGYGPPIVTGSHTDTIPLLESMMVL